MNPHQPELPALLSRALPFLRDEAAKYVDDGNNEPLELARQIESVLSGNPNRDASSPGGCECEKCGRVFIGAEWHVLCGICIDHGVAQPDPSGLRNGENVPASTPEASPQPQVANPAYTSMLTDAANMIENLRNGDDAYYTPEKMDAMQAALRTAALSRPQDGWVLVPVEPTREHIQEFKRAESICIDNYDDHMSPEFRGLEAVFAMLSATPTAGQGGDASLPKLGANQGMNWTPHVLHDVAAWHRRMNQELSGKGDEWAAREMWNCPHGRFATNLEVLLEQAAKDASPAPATPVSERARDIFAASCDNYGWWKLAQILRGSAEGRLHEREVIALDAIEVALEQALTQQRGEIIAWIGPRGDLIDNARFQARSSGLPDFGDLSEYRPLYTTPQPSAEGLRDAAEAFLEAADARDNEETSTQYPEHERRLREYKAAHAVLESLLACGGGK